MDNRLPFTRLVHAKIKKVPKHQIKSPTNIQINLPNLLLAGPKTGKQGKKKGEKTVDHKMNSATSLLAWSFCLFWAASLMMVATELPQCCSVTDVSGTSSGTVQTTFQFPPYGTASQSLGSPLFHAFLHHPLIPSFDLFLSIVSISQHYLSIRSRFSLSPSLSFLVFIFNIITKR